MNTGSPLLLALLFFAPYHVASDIQATVTVEASYVIAPQATLPSHEQLRGLWARNNYSKLLEAQGESGVVVSEWLDSPGDVSELSIFESLWPLLVNAEVKSSVHRTVVVQHRARGTPWTATASKRQRLREHADGSWTLDELSTVAGVPFCTEFAVHQRVRLTWSIDGRRLNVQAWVRVAFNDNAGRLTPRGRIQSGTLAECSEHQTVLAECARQLLSLVPDTDGNVIDGGSTDAPETAAPETGRKALTKHGGGNIAKCWLWRLRRAKTALFALAFVSAAMRILLREVPPSSYNSITQSF